MSSLRVESVRLCWIEAFVAVAEVENISDAARQLGLSQPTVTRYLQWLQKWLGKTLLEVGRISNPEDPRMSVALTEDGREFFNVATDIIQVLTGCRTAQAQSDEQIAGLKFMLEKMRADLFSEKPSKWVLREHQTIENLYGLVSQLSESAPLEALKVVNHQVRPIFAAYETERKREAKMASARKGGGIDIASLKL